LSLAVLLLIGDVAAVERHRQSLLQFPEENAEASEELITEQTLHEVEKQMGVKM